MNAVHTRTFATEVRRKTLEMVHRAKASHVGGALSMADILAVLYAPGGTLSVDESRSDRPDRDRFLLSKGHACTGLYATLALRGFIPVEELERYARDGERLMSHASHKVPGIELSTGSLGHALPVGCGLALGARARGELWRTVVLVSDGELDEGSNWEAILFAGHQRLGRLVLVVDYNKIQSLGRVDDVLGLEPLSDKFCAFGWEVREVDGHDHAALRTALDLDERPVHGAPLAVVAHTVKGKGVDFMEDRLEWHYKSPSLEQLEAALAQLPLEGA